MAKVIQFIREVKIELIKVTWPKKDELVGSTTVVMILSIILATFLWVIDTIIYKIVSLIYSR